MTEIELDGNNWNGTVTIPQGRYESLLDSEKMLLALEDAGVDNWNGYHYAIRAYNGEDMEDIW